MLSLGLESIAVFSLPCGSSRAVSSLGPLSSLLRVKTISLVIKNGSHAASFLHLLTLHSLCFWGIFLDLRYFYKLQFIPEVLALSILIFMLCPGLQVGVVLIFLVLALCLLEILCIGQFSTCGLNSWAVPVSQSHCILFSQPCSLLFLGQIFHCFLQLLFRTWLFRSCSLCYCLFWTHQPSYLLFLSLCF